MSTFEAAGRERYRLASEKRAAALVQKEDEMIMAGGDAFRRKADGPWQRLTSSELEWWQQKVGPPLPLMSGLGTTFDGDDQNPQFYLQGRQRRGEVELRSGASGNAFLLDRGERWTSAPNARDARKQGHREVGNDHHLHVRASHDQNAVLSA